MKIVKKTSSINFRIEDNLKEKMEVLALKYRVSLSKVVEEFCRIGLDSFTIPDNNQQAKRLMF